MTTPTPFRIKAKLLLSFLFMAMLLAFTATVRLAGQDTAQGQVVSQLKALFEQATAAEKANNYDGAIAAYSRMIEINPKMYPAIYNRAVAYEKKGEHAKAIADLDQVIVLKPDLVLAYNNLAWILATCPQGDCRDGKRAVELASKACDLTQWKNRAALDTMAAACAEAGDFDAAIKWQNAQLSAPGITPLGTANGKMRLAFYEAHKPFHEGDQNQAAKETPGTTTPPVNGQ